MPTTKIKLSKEVKAIVEDWKNRVGNRPALVSEELQKAVLAQCVLSLLIREATYVSCRGIKVYADLYFEASAALMLNNSDIETDRLVAEKFGI